jgi:hypothetical protein
MADGGLVGGFAAPATKSGLDGIPVPDTMFDESRNGGFNDGYAGGGLVAFARGGTPMADYYDMVEWTESRGSHKAVSPKGARGVMQLMPGTQRDPGFGVRPAADSSEDENRRVGREYLDAMGKRYGDPATALMAYNWGPGNVDKWVAAGRPASMVPTETRNYLSQIMGTKTGSSTERSRTVKTTEPNYGFELPGMDVYKSRAAEVFSDLPDAGAGEYRNELKKAIDPAQIKAERKQDMWMALANIGASMAASSSPNFLTAVGEAMHAALPGVESRAKERKDSVREAQKALYELGMADRKEAKELAKTAFDLRAQDIAMLGDERKLQTQVTEHAKDRVSEEQRAREQNASQERIAGMRGTQAKKDFDAKVKIAEAYITNRMRAGLPVYAPQLDEKGRPIRKVWDGEGRGKVMSPEAVRQLAEEMVTVNMAAKDGETMTAMSRVSPAMEARSGAAPAGPSSGWGEEMHVSG